VTLTELVPLAVGALKGLLMSTAFLLALFVGFCVLLGFPKLRQLTGRKTLVVRNLAERMGGGLRYLPPDAPRGPADQLHTPELSEQVHRQA
jgi:hypothetical protein